MYGNFVRFEENLYDTLADMKRWPIRLSMIVIAGILFLVFREWVWVTEPVEVQGVQVERGLFEETITNSRAGTVKARQRAHLSAEIGGRVVAVPFGKGDQVKKGDLLLKLNDEAEQAKLELTKRDLVVAEAGHDRSCLAAQRAKREYVRFRNLAEKELVSIDELDRVESIFLRSTAACEAGKANVDRARAAIVEAQAGLDKTILRAPFSGVLGTVEVEVGEWVTPAPPAVPVPPVLDLIDPNSIYITAPMDELDSAKIHQDQRVRVTVDPFPGQAFPGRLFRVAPFVEDMEEQNRTVEIEVELEDDQFAATLLPGTSADVEVILSKREQVLRVPRASILEGGKVWIVEDGHVAERAVKLGLKNWNYVEIQQGPAEREVVVTFLEEADVEVGSPVILLNSTH